MTRHIRTGSLLASVALILSLGTGCGDPRIHPIAFESLRLQAKSSTVTIGKDVVDVEKSGFSNFRVLAVEANASGKTTYTVQFSVTQAGRKHRIKGVISVAQTSGSSWDMGSLQVGEIDGKTP